MKDLPLGVVVKQQAFEIGQEDVSVDVGLDIEVDTVGVVVFRHEVPEEGDALRVEVEGR